MASKPARAGLFIMLLIVVLWLVAYPIAKNFPVDIFSDPFEKIYSGLNVLFTALAFGGVIVTLMYQADEARIARREETERSIYEMFQTFTSQDFQKVKDAAFRCLLAAAKNTDYAHFLASRLFVVEQLNFPQHDRHAADVLRALDEAKKDKNDESLIHADRADRLMLDNILNFFAMLAQRESSATVIEHCDFAYDWWRPLLWLVAQLQQDRHQVSREIQKHCRNQLVAKTLRKLDQFYKHDPLNSREDVWNYILTHPKIIAFGLDERFKDPENRNPRFLQQDGTVMSLRLA